MKFGEIVFKSNPLTCPKINFSNNYFENSFPKFILHIVWEFLREFKGIRPFIFDNRNFEIPLKIPIEIPSEHFWIFKTVAEKTFKGITEVITYGLGPPLFYKKKKMEM